MPLELSIHKRTRLAKRTPRRDILVVMRGYLNAVEPKIARWLHDTWNAEQEAIKYQELRDAILAGQVPQGWIDQWQQDYSDLVRTKFAPQWELTMIAAAQQLTQRYPEFVFDSTWTAVRQVVINRQARLPVQLTRVQMEALQAVIKRSAVMGDYHVDELSRVIRPLIGMVPREAIAVQNYYHTLRQEGISAKVARRQMLNYAARVHRHRAMRIARTELAFAFNEGMNQGIQQAQGKGYIGTVKKRWLTADDERVCPICGPLDERVVAQHEMFDGMYYLPPAHPHCRCAVAYEEED